MGFKRSQGYEAIHHIEVFGRRYSPYKDRDKAFRNIAKADLSKTLNARLIGGGEARIKENTVLRVSLGSMINMVN